MSSVQLLDKTRKIGRMLHNIGAEEDVLSSLCAVMGELLCSNVLLTNSDGIALGIESGYAPVLSGGMLAKEPGQSVAGALHDRFLSTLSTKENVNLMTLGFSVTESRQYKAMLVPFDLSGERVGTMFLYRQGEEYDIDAIILAEYAAVVAGLAMQQELQTKKTREQEKRQSARLAMQMLSGAEREAIHAVFNALTDEDSLLVASRVAKESGITRSVIINALRKFEGSGILEVRSLGMKGTRIRVLNPAIYQEL